MIGIYKITNKVNGKVYVGKSDDIDKMFEDCKRLNKEIAGSLPVFHELYTYGPEHFEFNILEECSKNQLLEKEQYYMSLYGLVDSSYTKELSSTTDLRRSRRKKQKVNVGLGLRRHIHRMRTDEEYRSNMVQKYKDNRPNSIPVEMIDKYTGEVLMTFPKLMEGARWIRENTVYTKADYSTINKVCKGNGRSAYGFKWRYQRQIPDLEG